MTIGEKIRILREAHEWSQAQLASRLGYKSRSTINKIELNINELTQSKILAFADVLGVSPCTLLDDEPLNEQAICKQWAEKSDANSIHAVHEDFSTPEEKELLSIFRDLNAEGKEAVLQNARICHGNPSLQEERQNASAI